MKINALDGRERTSPYHKEWEDLVDAIRNGKPYNEVPPASGALSLARV